LPQDFPAAVQDLGSLSTIYANYNVTQISLKDLYGSIHYDSTLPAPGLVLAKNAVSFQPFSSTDVNKLWSTTQDVNIIQFTPVVGHLYLIRTSVGSISNNWGGTDFYYKLLPIAVESDEVTLRWSVFYSATDLAEEDEDDKLEADIEDVEKIATAGLVIAVIAMFVITIGCCSLGWRWRREREFRQNKPASIRGGTYTQT